MVDARVCRPMLVFAYGTLADPERAAAVLDSFSFVGSAVLEGCHRVEGDYPTLVPGGSTEGRLLRVHDPDDRDALDRYEGVDRGLYVRVSIPLVEESGSVETYVGDPDVLRVGESIEWSPGDSLRERVERYVRENRVVVRHA